MIILLLVLGVYTAIRFYSLGAFVTLGNSFRGSCEVVATVAGPEALQFDPEFNLLYFISNNPCATSPARGGIYSIPLDIQKDAKPLSFDSPIDFQPHGLSFFRDGAQLEYLFTNNHRQNGNHTVEIFQIEQEGKLKHLETISDSQLTSPNDLVAVGPRQFYLTNDGRAHDRNTRSIDTFLGRKTGNVLFFDGFDFQRVADNLQFPNGIAVDTSTNQLIVAETLTGKLLFYQIVENGKLANVDNFYIKKGLDNISINRKGQILAAVHPNLWSLSNHMKKTDNPSPSQVFILDIRTKGLKIVYQQNGETLSGISAAIMINNSLYLGAVCDHKLLKCMMTTGE